MATSTQWLLVARERLLSPKRSRLARCESERQRYVEAIRKKSDERTRAKNDCERRIEALRAEVFAAQDGVVTSRMTALEREWRQIVKATERDQDGLLMDLWARVAPPEWIDRKRWRDTDPDLQLDAVIGLASDVDGVNVAEGAIHELLPNARIRWRMCARDDQPEDFPRTGELLLKSCASDMMDDRVYEAVLTRFPERQVLARAVAHAAFVGGENAQVERNEVERDGDVASSPRHAQCYRSAHVLRDLWAAGYVITSITEGGDVVTLEVPPLRRGP